MKRKAWIFWIALQKVAAIGLVLATTFVPGHIIDLITIEGDKWGAMSYAGFLAIVFVVANTLMTWGKKLTDHYFKGIEYYADADAIDRALGMRYQKFDSFRKKELSEISDIIMRSSLSKSVEAVANVFSQIALLLLLYFMYRLIDGVMVAVIVFLAVLTAVGRLFSDRVSFQLSGKYADAHRYLNGVIWGTTSVKYAKEARTYQLTDYLERKFDDARNKNYDVIKQEQHDKFKTDWIVPFSKGLTVLMSYGYSAYLYMNSAITVGAFLITATYITQVCGAVSSIADSVVSAKTERAYIKKLKEMTTGEAEQEQGAPITDEFMKDWTIEFSHVCFRYPGSEKYVLEDINLTIHKGDKISLVGVNGSGKSTLIKLLLGFYRPDSGDVLLNGKSIYGYDETEYLKNISIIFQDFGIFDYTIYENIAVREHTDDSLMGQIGDVTDKLDLSPVIDGLPDGLDTPLSKRFDPRGVYLSGGESQKLAFARCLLKKGQLMIFDEPTASLSVSAELEIYDWYRRLSKENTVILISHRLSGSRLSDRIVVLADGRIAEEGSHEELLAKNDGLYKAMFTEQAGNYSGI